MHMSSKKSPFAKIDEAKKRSIRIPTLVTQDEAAQIRASAEIRQMDVSEFMRRAALGRRADVATDVEIVLALSDITRTIRALHKAHLSSDAPLPEQEMLALIRDARAAMLRIEQRG